MRDLTIHQKQELLAIMDNLAGRANETIWGRAVQMLDGIISLDIEGNAHCKFQDSFNEYAWDGHKVTSPAHAWNRQASISNALNGRPLISVDEKTFDQVITELKSL